jgi:hypothetical protein
MPGGIIASPEGIAACTHLARYHALRLECKGLTRHGRSAYSIVKEVYGLRGSKQRVFEQFGTLLREQGIRNK